MTRVIAVVGPTATGKSDLGVALAKELGAEVVNADSMQLYRGMDIGTAKLTPAEQGGVTHHLLDVLEPTQPASVAAYQVLARELLTGPPKVFVGGSGLYLRAALDTLEFPGTDPELRARLEAELAEQGPAGCTSGSRSSTRAPRAGWSRPTAGASCGRSRWSCSPARCRGS